MSGYWSVPCDDGTYIFSPKARRSRPVPGDVVWRVEGDLGVLEICEELSAEGWAAARRASVAKLNSGFRAGRPPRGGLVPGWRNNALMSSLIEDAASEGMVEEMQKPGKDEFELTTRIAQRGNRWLKSERKALLRLYDPPNGLLRGRPPMVRMESDPQTADEWRQLMESLPGDPEDDGGRQDVAALMGLLSAKQRRAVEELAYWTEAGEASKKAVARSEGVTPKAIRNRLLAARKKLLARGSPPRT